MSARVQLRTHGAIFPLQLPNMPETDWSIIHSVICVAFRINYTSVTHQLHSNYTAITQQLHINYLRCIHCDLCVEACPTEAITESKLFEFSFSNRADAIYTKNELIVGDDGLPQPQPWELWHQGDDVATSGWMRATASAGNPEYQNRVGWSGELGYGIRTPEMGQHDPTLRSKSDDSEEEDVQPGDSH